DRRRTLRVSTRGSSTRSSRVVESLKVIQFSWQPGMSLKADGIPSPSQTYCSL
uniref:Uncharacterized protein n=1 Tax=Aegilops tauschii subsp. strangulata TaxID=200361 RepID=A0A453H1X5_AEGTS